MGFVIRLAFLVLIGAGAVAALLDISIWIPLVPIVLFVVFAGSAGAIKLRGWVCSQMAITSSSDQ